MLAGSGWPPRACSIVTGSSDEAPRPCTSARAPDRTDRDRLPRPFRHAHEGRVKAGCPPTHRMRSFPVIRQTRVAKSDDVKITFAIPADEPQGQVSVVGDFNDWTPGKHVLAKRANGTRSASVTLPKGNRFR